MAAPASPLESAALVIDNGSGTTKAGFAGDDAPRGVFPTVIGHPKIPGIMVGLEEREIYAGEEAKIKKGVLSLEYPIQRSEIVNWDAMELLWNYTMYSELKVPPEDHAILLSESPINKLETRQHTAKIMFDFFNVPCLYLTSQAVLALYASGHTTGLVIDSGEGTTHCVPIYEGFAVPHAIQKLPFAGRDITEYLQKLIQERTSEVVNDIDSFDSVQLLKEKIATTPIDYEMSLKDAAETAGFDKKEVLPDGRQILVGVEKLKAGECLFQPSLAGKEFEGLHRYANGAIKKCDENIKESLYGNILLSGGSTMMQGFGER